MIDTAYLIVDVQMVVDKVLLMLGKPRREVSETTTVWDSFGTATAVRGTTVTFRPVWSAHIVATAQNVLEVNYGVGQNVSAKCMLGIADLFADCGGYFDSTKEDYKALAARSFSRFGTDTEDEAIVACAERVGGIVGGKAVAVLTRDADLRSYLADLHIAAYTANDFTSATTK